MTHPNLLSSCGQGDWGCGDGGVQIKSKKEVVAKAIEEMMVVTRAAEEAKSMRMVVVRAAKEVEAKMTEEEVILAREAEKL